MALVEWVNRETGDRWTAPSGGYVPPSEAWTTDSRGDMCILPPPEDAVPEARPGRDTGPPEIIPEDPASVSPPVNPYGFTAPPADALVTMALVEWINRETGDRWTAPSGGYLPPSEAWSTDAEVRWPTDEAVVEPVEPEPQPPVEYFGSYAYQETRDVADDSGTVTGYELIFVSGDASGTWSRSTSVYFLDGRISASTYQDSSGFGYAFETLWSEDGTVLGQHHRYWGADSYSIENHYDADWRLLSSTYQSGDGSFRSTTEYSYGPDGTLTGGTTSSVWYDESGEHSQTDSFTVDPVPEIYLPPEEVPVNDHIHIDPTVGTLPVAAGPDGDAWDNPTENDAANDVDSGEAALEPDLVPLDDVDWTFIAPDGGTDPGYEPEIAICWWEIDVPLQVDVLPPDGGETGYVDDHTASEGIDPSWLRPAVIEWDSDVDLTPAPLVGVMGGAPDFPV